ncbi:ATP-binding protein [Paenibacillus rigui]|uniref:Histidine kinase/HSP90-like ATPase domain-containing protein n=1 Tax=Paenibacillus rigui TaxID=554312 RepID=A0A229UPJ4_9BACL|nr:ATP-binding protein [Paenibacillus rigui]OXM85284.1 hypothetical protein CF651_17000 [Paenibacillus rigui]
MILMTVESAPSQQLVDLSDEMMESFLKYSGVSQYRKLCFAVHELVVNAVESTLKLRESGAGKQEGAVAEEAKILIRMELNGDDIVITISNHGYGCDAPAMAELPKLSFDELLLEERGRGLLLAKRLSDQLTFDQDDQGRITMQLRKKGGGGLG